MKKIALLQRVLPHVRLEFYEILSEIIQSKGEISLDVYYGDQKKEEGLNEKIIDNEHFIKIKNYYLYNNLYYQFIYFKIINYDCVILEQAISPIINWLFLIRKIIGLKTPKVFLWGHGKKFHKVGEHYLLTKIRGWITRNSDWFFGYTTISKDALINEGYDESKISIINNSLHYDLEENNNVKNAGFKNFEIIFCGRLYEDKKIDLIIDSVELSRKINKNIQLILIGDGPEKKRLEKEYSFEWIQFLGAKYGDEKRRILLNGVLQILPSHIGLSILDCFAYGLPLITSNVENHCPEVAYFKHNYNGLISEPNKESIAKSINSVLDDYEKWKMMSINAITTAKNYDVTSMSKNFYKGLINATK